VPLLLQLCDSEPQRRERIAELTRASGCDPDLVDVSDLERAPSPDLTDAIVLIGLMPAEASTWLEALAACADSRNNDSAHALTHQEWRSLKLICGPTELRVGESVKQLYRHIAADHVSVSEKV